MIMRIRHLLTVLKTKERLHPQTIAHAFALKLMCPALNMYQQVVYPTETLFSAYIVQVHFPTSVI